jgi:hypothetical protein
MQGVRSVADLILVLIFLIFLFVLICPQFGSVSLQNQDFLEIYFIYVQVFLFGVIINMKIDVNKSASLPTSTKTTMPVTTLVSLSLWLFWATFNSIEVSVLCESLNDLVRSLVLKFLKRECIGNKSGEQLREVKCDNCQNWLSLSSVEIGVGTSRAIAVVSGEDERKELRQSFRKCLKTLFVYLQTNLPLASPLLRDMSCLNPINRKSEDTRPAISRLCLMLTKVTKTDAFCHSVTSEFVTDMCDTDPVLEKWTTAHSPTTDICEYWQYVSKMTDLVL